MAGRVLVDDELCHRGVVGERVCVPPERRAQVRAPAAGIDSIAVTPDTSVGREAQLTSRSSPVFTS